jgi:hypothetical protein
MMQVSGVLSFKGTDEGMCFHPNEFNSGMDKRVFPRHDDHQR